MCHIPKAHDIHKYFNIIIIITFLPEDSLGTIWTLTDTIDEVMRGTKGDKPAEIGFGVKTLEFYR